MSLFTNPTQERGLLQGLNQEFWLNQVHWLYLITLVCRSVICAMRGSSPKSCRGGLRHEHMIQNDIHLQISFNVSDIVVSLTVYADGELDMCGLCWVCGPVWTPASGPVSLLPVVVVGLCCWVQSLLLCRGVGNLVRSAPGHHGKGGHIWPSEPGDERRCCNWINVHAG